MARYQPWGSNGRESGTSAQRWPWARSQAAPYSSVLNVPIKTFFFKENSENSLHTRRFGGLDFVTIQLKKKKGKESLKDNIFFLRTLLTEGD